MGLLTRAITSAATLALLAGCSIGGVPTAAPPRNSTLSIRLTLPDAGALSKALGAQLHADTGEFAVPSTLRDDIGDAAPVECAGVAQSSLRESYRETPMRSALRMTWSSDGPLNTSNPYYMVEVAVVELDTAASAHTWYQKISEQWHRCQGKTVVEHNVGAPGNTFSKPIGTVSSSGELTTAAVTLNSADAPSTPYERALSTAGQYLIDAEVDVIVVGQSASGSTRDASAVAGLIADKINSAT